MFSSNLTIKGIASLGCNVHGSSSFQMLSIQNIEDKKRPQISVFSATNTVAPSTILHKVQAKE